METKEIIIKADQVCFTYEDGHEALRGVSMEIRRGSKVALMGANGSGKSTFFLCLNGINRPQSGTIQVGGKLVDYSRKGLLDLRGRVQIVFQDPDTQLFSASVYQDISFGILNLGVSEEDAKPEIERVIGELEITPFRDKPTHALSGGQKKQVSIADILVMHPEVIILDEPAAALDPRHTRLVRKTVDKLAENGITVLIATHDAEFALDWADEVYLFKEGRILMHGSPEEVFVNQSVLHETNLEMPAVLQMFQSLGKKGFLNPTLPLPKNLKQLERYVEQAGRESMAESVPQEGKKAILAVSFGTSFAHTREKTIDAIERDLAEAFPEYQLYRAWTSKMIIRRLKERDGIHIPTVSEAVEQMIADGVTHLIVQPTHVINGIENDLMRQDVLAHAKAFQSVRFGDPLLTTMQDNMEVIEAVLEELGPVPQEEALVFMGHGTTHYANAVYAALDYTCKEMGHPNVFIGTVEAYPSMEVLLRLVEELGPQKVRLAPFMIVAGDHATHDMAGDDPESWRCQFEKAGYQVECIMKGLGEYPRIRELLVRHARESRPI
ncbi:MAG: sirohydrochlorin cobaltochelatase [Eubacteriales bacterium]|jgi:cobalt/nickel transport system ATP-binding protein